MQRYQVQLMMTNNEVIVQMSVIPSKCYSYSYEVLQGRFAGTSLAGGSLTRVQRQGLPRPRH